MTDDGAIVVYHVGHAVPAKVNAADNVMEGVIFIHAYHVKRGFPILFHRHTHGDAQLVLKSGGCVGSQVIRLPQKGKKAALQLLGCAADSLNQMAFRVIETDGMQFVNFGGLGQYLTAVFLKNPGVRRLIQAGIFCDVHHPVCKHMDIGLHCFGRLPCHGL